MGPRGCSKAQNSLLNILRIISTIPPAPPEHTSAEGPPGSERKIEVFGIDLDDIALFPQPESADVDADVEKKEIVVSETEEFCQRSELSDKNGGRDSEGFMGLLIEAARLIFGEFNDDNYGTEQDPEKDISSEFQNSGETAGVDESIAARRMKRRCWTVGLYGNAVAEEQSSAAEASPVVRSKRGRIQMLPCKYRDAVLEPLTRFSRTRSTTILTNRRRSK